MQQRLVNGNQAFDSVFKYFSENFKPTQLLLYSVSIDKITIHRFTFRIRIDMKSILMTLKGFKFSFYISIT